MSLDTQIKDTTTKLDYQIMWDKLRLDMEDLMQKNIDIFHPAVILGYMNFIEQIEEAKKREGDEKLQNHG